MVVRIAFFHIQKTQISQEIIMLNFLLYSHLRNCTNTHLFQNSNKIFRFNNYHILTDVNVGSDRIRVKTFQLLDNRWTYGVPVHQICSRAGIFPLIRNRSINFTHTLNKR